MSVCPSVFPRRTPVSILRTSKDISMAIARDSLSEDLQTFQYSRLGCCGGKSWVQIRVGTRDFSLVRSVQNSSGASLTSRSKGNRWLFAGIKHDSDHAPPSRVEVKNEWSYTSAPPYAFMACPLTTLP